MNEEDLVIQLLTVENDLSQLNFKKGMGLDDPGRSIEELEGKIQSLKKSLETLSNKRYSNVIRGQMNKQITEYIIALSNIKSNAGRTLLSKNQFLSHSDFVFFSGFLNDLKKMVTSQYFGINRPQAEDLHNAQSRNDAIDINDLINFLKEERRILNSLENINFIRLRSYVEEVENRIKERFY